MGRIAGRMGPSGPAAVVDAHELAARLTPILGAATRRVVSRIAPILEWHRSASAARRVPDVRTELHAIGQAFDHLWTTIVESDPIVQARLFAHVDSIALFELRRHVDAAVAGAPPRPPSHRPIDAKRRMLYSQVAFALRSAGVAVSATSTGKFARTVRKVFELLQLEAPEHLGPALRHARDHMEPFGSDDDLD